MSFGSIWASVRNFAVIRTFADCEGHYTNTTTIRGYDKEEHGVPLRRDRVNHSYMRLMKLNDDTYACRLFQTNVVTFKRDGTIVVDLTYGSVSTREFAGRFLPYTSSLSSYTISGKEILSDRHGAYPAGYGTIELIQEAGAVQGRYVVNRGGLPAMGVKRVDRKKTKAPRALIKPLLDYANTIMALAPEGLTTEAVAAMRGESRYFALHQASVEDIANPDMWPVLVACAMRKTYAYSVGDFGSFVPASFADTIRDRAYALMGAYYTEILPVGETHPKMEKIVTPEL